MLIITKEHFDAATSTKKTTSNQAADLVLTAKANQKNLYPQIARVLQESMRKIPFRATYQENNTPMKQLAS
jgi:hypothetical protein